MLRDVPHCRSILKCGAGALIICVVVLTWIYPAYCSRVSEVKETKVREIVEDRWGIAGSSITPPSSEWDLSREISKAVDHVEASPTTLTPSTARTLEHDGAGDQTTSSDSVHTSAHLPASKMR